MKENLFVLSLITTLTLSQALACPNFSGHFQEYSPQFKNFLPTTLKISQTDCSQISIQSGKSRAIITPLNGVKKIDSFDSANVELSSAKIIANDLLIHTEMHYDQNPRSSHFTEIESEFFLDSGNNLVVESKSRENNLFASGEWKKQSRQFFKRI